MLFSCLLFYIIKGSKLRGLHWNLFVQLLIWLKHDFFPNIYCFTFISKRILACPTPTEKKNPHHIQYCPFTLLFHFNQLSLIVLRVLINSEV